MQNCKLPRDMLIEILSRLAVKSLMRFKCVCTFFYTLIKRDHDFMHKHYEISRAKKDDFAVLEFEPGCWPDLSNVYSLAYKNSESDEIGRIKLDIPYSNTRYVMCCHGMLCLILGRGDLILFNSDGSDLIFDVLIWNPSIKEIKTLPSVKVPAKPSARRIMHEGFGFGLSNNMSWKIVMLWYFDDINLRINDTHEIVMVCHQAGDSWSWRQINVVPHVIVDNHQNFYLKGRYYWCVDQESVESGIEKLLWFNLDDEIFGIIELRFDYRVSLVTLVNENIALLTGGDSIEIWLMNENDSNIYWHKQASIYCARSIDCHKYWTLKGDWNESWTPIGFWNLGGRAHLLILPNSSSCYRTEEEDEGYVTYIISIDIITQEWKFIYITQEGETINILPNSTGFVQIFSETTQENRNFMDYVGRGATAYVRVFNESLILL